MTPTKFFVDFDAKLKECHRCRVVLTFASFHRNKESRDGHRSTCKRCTIAYQRARNSAIKEDYSPKLTKLFFDEQARVQECSVCRNVLPFDDFYKNATKRQGINSECKMCRRFYIISSLYGLSRAKYEAMVSEQRGMCAICGTAMDVPHVDHCHATGKIRGLLCSGCNTGIGQLGDSPDRCEAAAAYLRRS